MSKEIINIVIADDNRFFCEALKDSLNVHEEFNITQTFTDLDALITYLNNYKIDVLILDVNFNGKNSLDFIDKIKIHPFKIITLTTLNNEYIKDNALASGVDKFVGKDEDFSDFKDIILEVYATNKKKKSSSKSKVIVDDKTITKRKINILEALYKYSDKNEKELSEILNISVSSLKTHKRELFEITNTKSTPELIKYGIQKGLIVA